MKLRVKLVCWSLFLSATFIFAQDSAPKNWFNLDLSKDGVPGVSTERTYQELLKGKKSKTVVVAVLDSGVDYEHEDLKDIMWVNEDEIPGNGIDDDKNGYIDDIHGWNFLGNAKGEDVAHDNLEVTRLYKKYKEMFEGRDENKLSKKEKEDYAKYKEYKKVVEEKRAQLEEEAGTFIAISTAINNLSDEIGKESISVEDLKNFKTDNPLMGYAVQISQSIMASEGHSYEQINKDISNNISLDAGLLNGVPPEAEHVFLKYLRTYVPAQLADGTAAPDVEYRNILGNLEKTRAQAKPLISVFN